MLPMLVANSRQLTFFRRRIGLRLGRSFVGVRSFSAADDATTDASNVGSTAAQSSSTWLLAAWLDSSISASGLLSRSACNSAHSCCFVASSVSRPFRCSTHACSAVTAFSGVSEAIPQRAAAAITRPAARARVRSSSADLKLGGLRRGHLPNQIGTAGRFCSLCGVMPARLLIVSGDCRRLRFVKTA